MIDLSAQRLDRYQQRQDVSPYVSVVTSALFRRPIRDVCRNPEKRVDTFFSHELPSRVDSLDQQSTGTCWLQAGAAVIALHAKAMDVTLLPSVTYLMFYDKLEKAAVFLNTFLHREGLDERTEFHMLNEPVTDGGTWSMLCHLVDKYGIVPKESYPETYQANDTDEMNSVLNDFLRKAVADLTVHNVNEYLYHVHTILTCCLSRPPSLTQLYSRRDGRDFRGTPRELVELLRLNLRGHECYVHAPSKTTPARFRAFCSNDFRTPRQHEFHTTTISNMKHMCFSCIKNGVPVWFTANVFGTGDFDRQLMDCDAVDFQRLFAIKWTEGVSKKVLMDCRCIAPNHAMVLIGAHCEKGSEVPLRWKVQNSWEKEKSHLVMTNDWFEKYVFEIAVPSEFAYAEPESQDEPHDLPPWDLLSTVAR